MNSVIHTADNLPVTIDGHSGMVDPIPREIKLKTADDVRLEMAKVYREMRRGDLDVSEGSKLVYVLGAIGKVIELTEIEKRISHLELTREQRKLR